MQIQYLEIVTKDVDAVCAAYAAVHDVPFGKPDASLGNARTASLASGGKVALPPIEIPRVRHHRHLSPGRE